MILFNRVISQAFPVDTFKPKVQQQHEVDPRTLPRNVAIERRRRQYQVATLTLLISAIINFYLTY